MITRLKLADLDPAIRKIVDELAPKKRKGTQRRPNPSPLEETFVSQCRRFGLPPYQRQHLFAKDKGRLWRMDFAFLDFKVAVECHGLTAVRARDGSILAGGGHTSFEGYKRDQLKRNTALLGGWLVLEFEQDAINNHTAIDFTVDALRLKGWTGNVRAR